VSEKTIDQAQVRQEHLAEVHQPAHWSYLVAVLFGGAVLMLVFIAWLGASAG
jgi:hypothetical protein